MWIGRLLCIRLQSHRRAYNRLWHQTRYTHRHCQHRPAQARVHTSYADTRCQHRHTPRMLSTQHSTGAYTPRMQAQGARADCLHWQHRVTKMSKCQVRPVADGAGADRRRRPEARQTPPSPSYYSAFGSARICHAYYSACGSARVRRRGELRRSSFVRATTQSLVPRVRATTRRCDSRRHVCVANRGRSFVFWKLPKIPLDNTFIL